MDADLRSCQHSVDARILRFARAIEPRCEFSVRRSRSSDGYPLEENHLLQFRRATPLGLPHEVKFGFLADE